MVILYDIGIFAYHYSIFIASFFHKKAKSWIAGRKNIFEKLEAVIPGNENLVWVHCASLGEFEQGRPIIEKIKSLQPGTKILLTFFSPSGYEIRKDYSEADYIFYLPIDTQANARQFINITKPRIAVFIKYEFWYHYLNQLHKNNIPTYIASAIFRKEQHFFKWYGDWWRSILKNITHIFVQNQRALELLKGINLSNISLSGDTRFDRVIEISQQKKSIPSIEQFKNNHLVLIAGSTWPEDEVMLIEFINSNEKPMKFIIAPHEIEEAKIERLEKSFSAKNCIRFSQASKETLKEAQVLIIDNIGMLSSLYQYAEIAYIGGGFGKGIHNILEAAVYGMPVIFGPNYHKFNEAVDLIERGGAFSINNHHEFCSKIDLMLFNNYTLKIAAEITKNYVREQQGATEKILDFIYKNSTQSKAS